MTQLEEDQALIDTIDNADADLDSREAGFIESCVRRLEREQTLTEKQREWARNIADRID